MQARERQLISLKHRVKVLTEVSPLSQFKKRFYSACWWHWRDHFIGSFEELDWARARPSSIDAFAHSLTTTEAKFLESYRKAWPAQVYQLNQTADSGFGATSQEWALATVISNSRLDVRGSGKQVDAADRTVGHTRLPSDPWRFQSSR